MMKKKQTFLPICCGVLWDLCQDWSSDHLYDYRVLDIRIRRLDHTNCENLAGSTLLD